MVLTWILIYVMALIPSSRLFWSFWEIITFISFSMIAPGLIVYIIYDIKKITAKFEAATILGKYHLHEGFVGVIFLILGFLLLGYYLNKKYKKSYLTSNKLLFVCGLFLLLPSLFLLLLRGLEINSLRLDVFLIIIFIS